MKVPTNRKQERALIARIEELLGIDTNSFREIEENIKILSKVNKQRAYEYTSHLPDANRNEVLLDKGFSNIDSKPYSCLQDVIKAYKSIYYTQTTQAIQSVLSKGSKTLQTLRKDEDSWTLAKVEKISKLLLNNVFNEDVDGFTLYMCGVQIIGWEIKYILLRDNSLEAFSSNSLSTTSYSSFLAFYLGLIRAFHIFEVLLSETLIERSHINGLEEGTDITGLVSHSEVTLMFIAHELNYIERIVEEWEEDEDVIENKEYQVALSLAKRDIPRMYSHLEELEELINICRGKNKGRIVEVKEGEEEMYDVDAEGYNVLDEVGALSNFYT